MTFALSFVTIIGLIIGHLAMKKGNKKLGYIQAFLNVILVLFTALFCLSKEFFEYNGTDSDYLFVRALSGKSVIPLFLLILFIILEVITFINLFDIMHIKDKYKAKLIKKLKALI